MPTERSMMARGPMMRDINDDRSIGTTQSADTVRRSNCSHIMPTKRSMMTRGAAWNVIRERNWVQQTIADRDKRWLLISGPHERAIILVFARLDLRLEWRAVNA